MPRPVTPVGLLAQALDEAQAAAKAGTDDSTAVAAVLQHAHALAAGLDPYVAACTTPESPALKRLAERTQAYDWPSHDGAPLEQEMLSGHVEGQLLKLLVRLTRATRVLEIGMFTGYSALAMAEALPADGVLIACEVDAAVARLAQECFDDSPGGERIDVRVGPAAATLDTLADDEQQFDFVFLDADKPGYTDYFRALLDRDLLAPGGLLCADNTLMQGEPYLGAEPTANGAAIAAFNDVVARDERVEQVLLPLRDGLTLIRRL
ncbi:class I SAM-dependent methyltransferase [Paraconexibacter sp. AEG42_29]|uniref:O-methyltransferase n=1 Tax=Paraconexibacter sp. AEG42_29 TaxID=2997339 RepID=UPI00339D9240